MIILPLISLRETTRRRKGGMPEMTLEYVLKSKGLVLNEDVVVRTDVQFDALAGAFISGEGDYVTPLEPVATTLEKEGQGYVVASIGVEEDIHIHVIPLPKNTWKKTLK